MRLIPCSLCIFLITKLAFAGILECEQICKGITTKSLPKAGRPGRPGPPGPTDYKAIDKAVDFRMKEITKSLDQKMTEMQKTYDEKLERTLKSMKDEIKNTKEALCPIRYNNKCFWIVSQADTNYKDAENICAKVTGGQPANIYDKEHYNLLIRHMRTLVPEDLFGIYLWIGMSYDWQSKKVKFFNGKTPTFTKWREHFPSPSVEYTKLLIMARRDENEKHEGIYNQNPIYGKPGVLCEA